MPSRPVAILATVLIIVLYALVPAGRSREWGKLAVAVILAVTIVSRAYLAQDAPSDALVGMVFGVAIPLAAFRLFTPTSVYPVSYRRGRTAHLDLSGRRLNLTGRYADLRADELTSVFGFVGRGNLDERIGDVSDHRLHLDPTVTSAGVAGTAAASWRA